MLQVPASAEFVLEGHIPTRRRASPARATTACATREIGGYLHALEGPFGDHTGYYNEQDWFPVFEIERMTHRRDPIYHSTYTGKPPDEPAVLGVALNEVFVPILQKQFPEIVDFYLPPEGCSYRMAIVSIRKQYPGHAKRVMFGVWSFLRQFMYTKFIVVTDEDVDIRSWPDVIWAITTRMDPVRDTVLVDSTPIDSLDFASPVAGWAARSASTRPTSGAARPTREWGRPIRARPGGRRRGSASVIDAIAAARPRSRTVLIERRRPRDALLLRRSRRGRCRGAAAARSAAARSARRPTRQRPTAARLALRPGLQTLRHADQDAADQRRIAVEHRLRRAHADCAAVAQRRLRLVHQLLDRLRRLGAGGAALHLHRARARSATGPAAARRLARLGAPRRRTCLPSSRCWRAPP